MTTEKLPFDKGESPTGVYITDPAMYGVYVEFAETLPIDLKEDKYERYNGHLVSLDGHDPYAFQSKQEVDDHIKFIADKFWELGEDMVKWRDEQRVRAYAEAEQLKLKYGVRVELPEDDEE